MATQVDRCSIIGGAWGLNDIIVPNSALTSLARNRRQLTSMVWSISYMCVCVLEKSITW